MPWESVSSIPLEEGDILPVTPIVFFGKFAWVKVKMVFHCVRKDEIRTLALFSRMNNIRQQLRCPRYKDLNN